MWLKIQNAYETLSDAAKRKKYDSSLPFDDNIPSKSDAEDEKEFYKVFSKCFNNNARFSVNKPVPNLGDENTPLEDVHKFYKFWDNFKTWREFSQYDEYDLEDAQDRYEKRWMEKQNKKCREKYEKEERKRLFDLTNLAYECDPRIKAQVAKEEAERLAIKQAKKDAKAKHYQEIEERKRKEEEEKQMALHKEEELKKQEQERKKEEQKLHR